MKKIVLILVIIGTLFFSILYFGLRMLGDRYCQIEIQNGSDKNLIYKTFLLFENNSKLLVDSICLNPNEKLIIGNCINCYTIDTLDLDFDLFGIYDYTNKNYVTLNRSEFLEYLLKFDKTECATFVVK